MFLGGHKLIEMKQSLKHILFLSALLIISVSCDYENKEENMRVEMTSFYSQGITQSDSGEYAASIISFFNAEKLAKELDDKLFLGEIYRSVSDIYSKVYNSVEAQNYSRMSYDCFVGSEKTDYINRGLEHLANAYFNNKDYSNSIALSGQLAEIASVKSDTLLQHRATRLLANSYIQSNKYNEAKTTLLHLMDIVDTPTPEDYSNLSLSYFKLGQLDSANIYRKHIADDDKLYLVINLPGKGFTRTEVIEREDTPFIQDSLRGQIVNQYLAQTVANYHIYEDYKAETELRHERNSKIVIILIAVILILSLSGFYYLHTKAYRKEMEMKMLEAENIRNILNVSENDCGMLKESVNQLFEEKFKYIDELCNTYYIYQGSTSEKAKIYSNVINSISNLREDKKTIVELERFVDKYKSGLMSEFRSAYPEMKPEDYQLFLYVVVKFSSRAISILIGESLPVVYNRKSRLKREIMQSSYENKEHFLKEFA